MADFIVTICKLMNDGSSNYDWYFYSNTALGAQGIRVQTVPGKICYGSNWETAHTYARHTVVTPGVYRWLVDYDPTTTDGYTSSTKTAAVTISPQGGGASYSQSYTYNIPYIKVIDKSDFEIHQAYWEHDFNEKNDPAGSPSDSTYLARPAFVVKTTQNAWSLVNGWYSVMWGRPLWFPWDYQSFQSGTLYLDAMKSGDV